MVFAHCGLKIAARSGVFFLFACLFVVWFSRLFAFFEVAVNKKEQFALPSQPGHFTLLTAAEFCSNY